MSTPVKAIPVGRYTPLVEQDPPPAPEGWTAVLPRNWSRTPDGEVYCVCPTCNQRLRLKHKVDRFGGVSPKVICAFCGFTAEFWLQGWESGDLPSEEEDSGQ